MTAIFMKFPDVVRDAEGKDLGAYLFLSTMLLSIIFGSIDYLKGSRHLSFARHLLSFALRASLNKK